MARPRNLTANDPDHTDFVFIVGSPRSGTTVLGEILDRHPGVSQWYEPYFVWDHHFRDASHDERTEADATRQVRRQIYDDFQGYRRYMGGRIIVDKSPRNSLKIPFVRRIFPEARFIHILRDGRDATLSIYREWQRRVEIVQDRSAAGGFNYRRAFDVIGRWLKRQPRLKDRARALWFETHGHLFNRSLHLNRKRWNGAVGWGPRFFGWEQMLKDRTLLQFNALQWLNCTERILMQWPSIPEHRKLDVRYESLITEGPKVIERILSFIGLSSGSGFYDRIPKLNKTNSGKWKNAFTRAQGEEIAAVVAPMLRLTGYASNSQWVQQLKPE